MPDYSLTPSDVELINDSMKDPQEACIKMRWIIAELRQNLFEAKMMFKNVTKAEVLHSELEKQLKKQKQENEDLRGLLGNSAKDCVYCGLPAVAQAKCASGFPGCARSDDQMLSKHFAAAYQAEQNEKEIMELRALLAEALKDILCHSAEYQHVTKLSLVDKLQKALVGKKVGLQWTVCELEEIPKAEETVHVSGKAKDVLVVSRDMSLMGPDLHNPVWKHWRWIRLPVFEGEDDAAT